MNFNEIKQENVVVDAMEYAILRPYLGRVERYITDAIYDMYLTYGIDITKIEIRGKSVYVTTIDGYDVLVNLSVHKKKKIKYDLQFAFKRNTEYTDFFIHFLNIMYCMNTRFGTVMSMRFVNIYIESNKDKAIVWQRFNQHMNKFVQRCDFFANRIHFKLL